MKRIHFRIYRAWIGERVTKALQDRRESGQQVLRTPPQLLRIDPLLLWSVRNAPNFRFAEKPTEMQRQNKWRSEESLELSVRDLRITVSKS
jgi:hypothetical protein